jgi:hypothetical protein
MLGKTVEIARTETEKCYDNMMFQTDVTANDGMMLRKVVYALQISYLWTGTMGKMCCNRLRTRALR